jgi:uncharacterized MnhB-related membrane protein
MGQTMTSLLWLVDGLLIFSLVWLAWLTLAAKDLFKAIVLFVAFGLTMALTWARLRATDIALVEAAIGAGLTGALLLSTLHRIAPDGELDASSNDRPSRKSP